MDKNNVVVDLALIAFGAASRVGIEYLLKYYKDAIQNVYDHSFFSEIKQFQLYLDNLHLRNDFITEVVRVYCFYVAEEMYEFCYDLINNQSVYSVNFGDNVRKIRYLSEKKCREQIENSGIPQPIIDKFKRADTLQRMYRTDMIERYLTNGDLSRKEKLKFILDTELTRIKIFKEIMIPEMSEINGAFYYLKFRGHVNKPGERLINPK